MKRKKIISGITAGLLCAFLLTGCGAASTGEAKSENYATEEMAAAAPAEVTYDEATGAPPAENSTAGQVSVAENRKLIKNVNMSVETESFDSLLGSVNERIAALGGYVENSDMGKNAGYDEYTTSRYANLTIRIPKDKLDQFVTAVSAQSNVLSKSESTQDVTLQYVDVESHKKSLEIEQKRLLELLEKAASIEDIIALENRLSEVRYQIESTESQMRTYDNLIDYSTVYLYISEVYTLTPQDEQSAGERIALGLTRNIKNIGKGIRNFGIEFVIAIPYIILWGVIFAVLILIILKLRKNAKKKREKRNEIRQENDESKL